MFLIGVGIHTVKVTATDNLDHAGDTPRTFEIHTTTASLLANLERAARQGDRCGDGRNS
jgi:hypothetical protein